MDPIPPTKKMKIGKTMSTVPMMPTIRAALAVPALTGSRRPEEIAANSLLLITQAAIPSKPQQMIPKIPRIKAVVA